LEQGREVFAAPGAVDSPASAGCLELIRSGARLVRSADDILEDLKGIAVAEYKGPGIRDQESVKTGDQTQAQRKLFPDEAENSSEPPPNLDPVQRQIFDLLASRRHADELAREAGLAVGELSRVLTQLELKRVVRRLPGNSYERR
jgi:DNA processing protein